MNVNELIDRLLKLPRESKILFTETEKNDGLAEYLNGENKVVHVAEIELLRDQNPHSIFAVVPATFDPE